MKIFLSAILFCSFLNSGSAFAESQITDFNLRSLQALAPAKELMSAGRRTILLEEMLSVDVASQFAQSIISIGSQQVVFEPNFKPVIKGASAYIYLQFSSTPSASELAEIKELGIEMSGYLKGNTWVAKIPTAALDTLHTKSFVHALADILPQDKMSAKVFQKGFAKRSINSNETHSVLVSLRTPSDEQAFADLIASYQGDYTKIDRNQFLVTIADASLAEFIQETIVAWIDNAPLEATSENSNSGTRNGSTVINNTLGLRGENVRLALWDVGDVAMHNDLNDNLGMDRVNHAYNGSISLHATHVAGTMIGNGSENSMATGMAPEATLWSYSFETRAPLTEMIEAVANDDIHSANHSWGFPVGWTYYSNGGWTYNDNVQTFGEYGIKTQQWDQAVVDSNLVMAVAAGNDRNDRGNATPEQPADYAHLNGYDTIANFKNAKNVITVGSVDKNDMSSTFSSWGPSDDGRIKPDLVAIGTNILSTSSSSPASYSTMSGTSMSTPAVSAIAGLVREHYESTIGLNASAAMVKAVLIQTAEDMGRPGPDYQFGWGMVRADNAIQSIKTDSLFVEGNAVYLGQEFVHTFDVTSTDDDVKVTLVWTDIPAAPFSTKTLINDFNLELVDPNGVVHLPWVLGGLANPEQNATRGVNTVDNVEQVVAAPVVGEWEIRIHTNALEPGTSQAYSVVNNTGKGPIATCSDYTDTNQNHETQARAYSESSTEGQVCFGTFCWGGTTVSTWYANGSNDNLGTSGSTQTTLHSFSTAPQTFLVDNCPVIPDSAPVIDSLNIDVDGLTVTVSGSAFDVNNDLTEVELQFETNGIWVMATGLESWTYTKEYPAGTFPFHQVEVRITDSNNNQTSEIANFDLVEPEPGLDTVAPVITLNGSATIQLTIGDNYIEQGAAATDNTDGDITAQITQTGTVDTNTAATYIITYSAVDAAGNSTSVIRTIVVSEPALDTTAPVITLNGSATIELTVGDNYVEQGANATDDIDGDITGQINISGTVDTNTEGTYQLTYSVTDTAENQSSIVRTVEVTSSGTEELACELDSISTHLTANRVKVLYSSLYYSTDAAETYLGSTYVNANDVISMQEVVTGGWAAVSACP